MEVFFFQVAKVMGILRYNPKRAVSHPLGVKPAGNMYLDDCVDAAGLAKQKSLGQLAAMSEYLLIELLGFCDGADLVTLSGVSMYMRAFSFHTDLWRELFWANDSVGTRELVFRDSWRDSYFASFFEAAAGGGGQPKRQRLEATRVRNVFSDLLFAPYRASGLEPTPQWIVKENIDRVAADSLSVADFVERYEKPNKPVILTGYLATHWAAFAQWRSVAALAERAENPTMECGAVEMRIADFEKYLASAMARLDESPIFIFDTKSFGHQQRWQKEYAQIPFFGPDLFDLLTGENRPDHKWLLVGGAGASSKWHVDPNSTNAWNAVITGAKKWILLPPHLGPPPGVEVSSDGFAVRQPSTLTDWLDSGFYDEMVRMHGSSGLVEATCNAGEVMFIPRGWWHCVRNVGDEVTIAVTQNYAAESSVTHVRRFLKEMSHCVSGVPLNRRSKLWIELDVALHANRPDLVEGIDIDALIAESNEQDEVESTGSCCGGEVVEFSFWDHFATSNKNLNFHR